jgi:hypothetical protein
MKKQRGWFYYFQGSTDPYDPINYFYTTFVPSCTASGRDICSVLACYEPWFGVHPYNFPSPNLATYISDAMAAGTPRPAIQKKYVYVRPV